MLTCPGSPHPAADAQPMAASPSLPLIPAVSPEGVGGEWAGQGRSRLANHLWPALPPFRANKGPLRKRRAGRRRDWFGLRLGKESWQGGSRQKKLYLHKKRQSTGQYAFLHICLKLGFLSSCLLPLGTEYSPESSKLKSSVTSFSNISGSLSSSNLFLEAHNTFNSTQDH